MMKKSISRIYPRLFWSKKFVMAIVTVLAVQTVMAIMILLAIETIMPIVTNINSS